MTATVVMTSAALIKKNDRGESMDQACCGTSVPSALTGASFSKSIQKSLVGLKFLEGTKCTLDLAAVETLSNMVCGANYYYAVSEPMGQHSLSSKTGSDGCAVLAMD